MDAFNFVTGARAGGMGGAAIAAVADPTALQWNPAALSLLPRPSVVLSHLAWVAGINYSYVGLTAPTKLGTVGASMQMLNYGSIESTKGLASPVDASDFGITLGGAIPPVLGFRVGGAMKIFRHVLAGSSVSEVALDAGGSYDLVPDKLTAGIVIQNIGYSGKLLGRSPPLPTTVSGGLAYSSRLTQEPIPVVGHEPPWSPAVDLVLEGDLIAWQKSEKVHYSLGAEVIVAETLMLRTGFLESVSNAGSGAGFCVGGGVKVLGMRLDYAYGAMGDLGKGQYITMTWIPPKKVVPLAQAPADSTTAAQVPAESATTLIGAKTPARPAEAAREYNLAVGPYNNGDFDAAILHATAAVNADSSHWEAWQLLGHAKYAKADKKGALEAYRNSLLANPENAQLKSWVRQVEDSLQ